MTKLSAQRVDATTSAGIEFSQGDAASGAINRFGGGTVPTALLIWGRRRGMLERVQFAELAPEGRAFAPRRDASSRRHAPGAAVRAMAGEPAAHGPQHAPHAGGANQLSESV